MNGSTVESPLLSHEHNIHFGGAHNLQNSVLHVSERSHSCIAVRLGFFLALNVE